MQKRKPTRNKNPTPGDIRLLKDDGYVRDQPLNDQQKELVRRAYELFEFFREKLQAANAEDIKVRCGWFRVRWAGMRGCVLRGQSLSLRKKSLLQVAQLRKDLGGEDRMCG